MSDLSRQRKWQILNPEKAKLLREQTTLRKRYNLLEQGIIKTYEEIWEITKGYEDRHQKLTGKQWWDIFEYLDWKYNNSAFTDLSFSRKLETEWKPTKTGKGR